jgi:DNA-directed RNA polymerase subunit L
MVRRKGDKDYSKREKQMMISLINDYSLIGTNDDEIIQMLSEKLGKKISETTFYRLKKEAKAKRGDSEQWLDYYARYQFVEFYRKRIEEIELVQRKLLKILIEETDKQAEKQDKTLINHLAKTIADNSKVLAEFGMAPPFVSKIKNMISMNNINTNENNRVEDEELRALIEQPRAKSGFHLPMDNENESRKINESQCVF